MSTTARPVADGLFTWPSDEPQLVGATCTGCGVTTFPAQSGCPRCTAEAMEEQLLPRRGTLWTFTTQEFRPKSPPYAGTEPAEDFEPYGVGYVDLGTVTVESRLTERDPDKLRIGMRMQLAIVPFPTADGDVLTFAFEPVTD